MPPRGRPKTGIEPKQPPKAGTQIAFRVTDELLAEIDAEVERMHAENPGATFTRAEAARNLIHLGVRARATRKAKGAT